MFVALCARPFIYWLFLGTAAALFYSATVQGEGPLVIRSAAPGGALYLPMETVTFRTSEPISHADIHVVPSIPGEVRIKDRHISFHPAEPMRPGAVYRFTVHANTTADVAGARETFDVAIDPSEDRWVYVALDAVPQWVDVFEGDDLVKRMLASGGRSGYETPAGTFRIQNRGHHFYSQKYGEGAYFWVRIYGNYLFHSVPVDIDGNIIEEEAKKLGCPASHGCVRLSMPDAEWFYEHVPDGARVVIDRK